MLEFSTIIANWATVLGLLGIVYLYIQLKQSKDLRNLQLMQRCIDNFRQWSLNGNSEIDLNYLELLNEELFYFQYNLIDPKVAVEWIEGILDLIQVKNVKNVTINKFAQQVDIENLQIWKTKQGFYRRIHFFIKPGVDLPLIPTYDEGGPSLDSNLAHDTHAKIKREVAIKLHGHIQTYKF